MAKAKVSMAVIRRLPKYYRYLTELSESGVMRISSNALAKRMGFTASQIRQDLNCFGGFGQQGYGYNVDSLLQELAEILGLTQGNRAIIIGAGNLGRALMNNFDFKHSGFVPVAAFDANEELIGTIFNGIPVLNIKELDDFQKKMHPELGILTIPPGNVHEVAKKLYENGIKGLWNFTNVDLQLEGFDIPVENVRFVESLMALSYRMNTNNKE